MEDAAKPTASGPTESAALALKSPVKTDISSAEQAAPETVVAPSSAPVTAETAAEIQTKKHAKKKPEVSIKAGGYISEKLGLWFDVFRQGVARVRTSLRPGGQKQQPPPVEQPKETPPTGETAAAETAVPVAAVPVTPHPALKEHEAKQPTTAEVKPTSKIEALSAAAMEKLAQDAAAVKGILAAGGDAQEVKRELEDFEHEARQQHPELTGTRVATSQ